MAKNDRNNQQGKLGELRVAEAFLKSGCVVNLLSFMDVGLDLLVQLPKGPKPPGREKNTWSMSGMTAHIQVKSTRTDKLPAISTETAHAWRVGALAGTPTLVVAVVVDPDTDVTAFRFFDPLVINSYAETTSADTFKVSVSRGQEVDPGSLFQHTYEWVEKSRFYFADGIGFRWPRLKAELWDSALEMVGSLTRIHERAFQDPQISLENQPYMGKAGTLMRSFLDGVGVRDNGQDEILTHTGSNLLEETEMRAHDMITDAASEKHGWSDWVDPLASVSPTVNEDHSLSFLENLCFDYGSAVAGKWHLP